MKFSQQIKHNHSHKERNFVEYDAFTVNRPENRLLKATLLYLYKHSTSSKNRNDIKILLNSFGEIEASVDYKADFSKYIPDRNMKDYSTALLWSKVFLMGKSFTSFAGSEVAVALLFPMETLFESYIATLLKKELGIKGYLVSAQDRKYHLFDEPDKKFLMKPDIVITNKANKSIFVMDTKWKVLSDSKHNYGIIYCAVVYNLYSGITIKKPAKKSSVEQQRNAKVDELNAKLEEATNDLNSILIEKSEIGDIAVVGLKIRHKMFGEGTVISQDGNIIIVNFATGEKKFALPMAFAAGFLICEEKDIIELFTLLDVLDKKITSLRSTVSSIKTTLERL